MIALTLNPKTRFNTTRTGGERLPLLAGTVQDDEATLFGSLTYARVPKGMQADPLGNMEHYSGMFAWNIHPTTKEVTK